MTTNFSNNSCWNDFTVRNGASGGLRKIRVQNENNTADSSACVEAYVQGTTAADPFFRSVIGATHSYAVGIDTSVDRDWKLTYDASATATPSSALQIIDADLQGRILYPNQPMLLAVRNANAPTVTGDNTNYGVVFEKVIYDRGGSYNNATGVYTVPKSGVYSITALVSIYALAAGYTDAGCFIRVGGVLIYQQQNNPFASAYLSGGINKNFYSLSTHYYCAAGQTIDVYVNVNNTVGGGAIVGVQGGDIHTSFTVNLLG